MFMYRHDLYADIFSCMQFMNKHANTGHLTLPNNYSIKFSFLPHVSTEIQVSMTPEMTLKRTSEYDSGN
jgi:hypothetical protein